IVRTGNGDDVVSIGSPDLIGDPDLIGNPDLMPAVRHFQFDLGNGDDTLIFSYGDPNQRTRLPAVDVTAHGGRGNDNFRVQVQNVLVNNPDEFNVYGDEGADTFNVRLDNVLVVHPDEIGDPEEIGGLKER